MEALVLGLGLASASIALVIFFYPDIYAVLQRRENERRMSRRWRAGAGQRRGFLPWSWSWPRKSKRRRHTSRGQT